MLTMKQKDKNEHAIWNDINWLAHYFRNEDHVKPKDIKIEYFIYLCISKKI